MADAPDSSHTVVHATPRRSPGWPREQAGPRPASTRPCSLPVATHPSPSTAIDSTQRRGTRRPRVLITLSDCAWYAASTQVPAVRRGSVACDAYLTSRADWVDLARHLVRLCRTDCGSGLLHMVDMPVIEDQITALQRHNAAKRSLGSCPVGIWQVVAEQLGWVLDGPGHCCNLRCRPRLLWRHRGCHRRLHKRPSGPVSGQDDAPPRPLAADAGLRLADVERAAQL